MVYIEDTTRKLIEEAQKKAEVAAKEVEATVAVETSQHLGGLIGGLESLEPYLSEYREVVAAEEKAQQEAAKAAVEKEVIQHLGGIVGGLGSLEPMITEYREKEAGKAEVAEGGIGETVNDTVKDLADKARTTIVHLTETVTKEVSWGLDVIGNALAFAFSLLPMLLADLFEIPGRVLVNLLFDYLFPEPE